MACTAELFVRQMRPVARKISPTSMSSCQPTIGRHNARATMNGVNGKWRGEKRNHHNYLYEGTILKSSQSQQTSTKPGSVQHIRFLFLENLPRTIQRRWHNTVRHVSSIFRYINYRNRKIKWQKERDIYKHRRLRWWRHLDNDKHTLKLTS